MILGIKKSRRRPTLPLRCRSSTIGAEGLNYRIRNGNGCGPFAITTRNFFTLHGPPASFHRKLGGCDIYFILC